MRRILDLLAALERADVDYVVVGGVAVVLRGHARMTVDLDLALDLASENVIAVLDVLRTAGLVPRLITMKRSSGRPQDLADALALSKLSDRPIVDGDERDHT